MEIVATVTICVTVGVDSFRDHHISRCFSEDRTIKDILSWAKLELGRDDVCIGDIVLSDYTGKSI